MKIEEVLVKNILSNYKMYDFDIVGLYLWGSRLYGNKNFTEDSDYDFICIHNGSIEDFSYNSDICDIHFYSEVHFKEMLINHDLKAIECYYQFDNAIKPLKDIQFNLDLTKLRKTISSMSNHSWVKAKKKISIEDEDSKIGLKSLSHSFRIIDFGIQIAKNNKIDFNYLTMVRDSDISNIKNPSWNYWFDKLKKTHNKKLTEFKLLTPKK